MALGEASVPIRATLDKLDSDLNRARGKIDGALGNLQKVGKVALGGAIAGVGLLGAAGTAAAVGIGKLAANAEPLVGLQAGFAATTERIGSSSETMLAALEDASGGLITNRELMESTNKAAALVGDDFAKTLPDAMSLVQKAALSTGQDMGFLMDSLVTGVGRVSPMILDNLGIQVALADVTEHAAEMFGKSAEELSKQEQQMALNEIVLGKLNDAYGDVPDVEQPFAKARTAIANLKDEIGLKLLPVVAPLVEKMLELAQRALPVLMDVLEGSIIPALQGVSEALVLFLDTISTGGEPISALTGLVWRLAGALGASDETAEIIASTFYDVATAVRDFMGGMREALAPVMEWISNNVQLKDVLIGLGIAIASVVIPIIASIVASLAPVILIFAAVTGAVALARRAWEENWGGIRDILTDVWNNHLQPAFRQIQDWLQVNIPRAIEALKAFWENTLKPALMAIGSFIRDNVLPAYMEFGAWMREKIPVAMEAVKSFWENTLRPALMAIWAFVQDNVIPVISSMVGWLQENVPAAMGAVQEFWEGTLKPALEALWSFVEENVIPVIESFVDVVVELAEIAFTALQGAWENLVKPALEALWNIIQENVTPAVETAHGVIEDISDFLERTFGPVVQTLVDGALAAIQGAFNGIKSALQGIKTWLDNVKAGLEDLKDKLPWWAIPGSPSPFEESLRGMTDALQELNVELRNLGERLVEAGYDMEGLLDVAGGLSSIGGAIGSIFKAREIDPLEEKLQGINDALEESSERINEFFAERGFEDFDILALTAEERLQHYFKMLQEGNVELANDILNIDNLLADQENTTQALSEAQQELLNIQKQQQDLRLLQAQQDLLDLIAEHDLSTALLQGLEFGLDASLADILQATSFAMQQIIQQAEEELGVSSPSKKFAELGQQISAGLQQGMVRTQAMVQRTMGGLLQPPSLMPASSGAGGFGQLVINVDARGAEDPSAVRRAARSAVDEALAAAGISTDARRRI